MILLSDGQTNQGAPAEQILAQVSAQAREMDLNLCTIGFGNEEGDIDVGLLRGLAEAATGQYLFATTAQELISFFVTCRQGLVSPLVDQFAGVVRQGEMTEAGQIDVRDDVGELTLTFNYLQGRLAIELVDSEGNVIDATYPGVTLEQGQAVQMIKVTNPRPGEWIVRVTANEAPPDGVPYHIVVNVEPRPTPIPAPTLVVPTATPVPISLATGTPTPTATPQPSPAALKQTDSYLGLTVVGLILLVGGSILVLIYLKRSRAA